MRLHLNALLILSAAYVVDCLSDAEAAVSPSALAEENGSSGSGNGSSRLGVKTRLTRKNNNKRKRAKSGKSDDESFSSSKSSKTGSKSSKKSKRSKKKKKKDRPPQKDKRTRRPSPPPTPLSNDEENSNLRYDDSENHTLTSDKSSNNPEDDNSGYDERKPAAYTNIVLENDSHLTVESGITIEAKGGFEDFNDMSAISVRGSSLVIEGVGISVRGSSFEYNDIGGYGGHGITFFGGSKGKIGCNVDENEGGDVGNNGSGGGGTDPKPPGFCEIASSNPDHYSACGVDSFCRLDVGVCNQKSFYHKGTCTEPTPGGVVCFDVYEPVCGCDGEDYGNACEAGMMGVSVSREGNCDADKNGDGTSPTKPPDAKHCEIAHSDPDHFSACGEGRFCQLDAGVCNEKSVKQSGKCRETGDYCIEVYDPVCGCDGKTYGNACKAGAMGVSVSLEGECDRAVSGSVNGDNGGGDAWDCQVIGQCEDPFGQCGPHVRCSEDPCSWSPCVDGEECRINSCGGCHAVCTCPEDQCRDPEGECAAHVYEQCTTDPCKGNPCGSDEKCDRNYCGGCHAVCTPVARHLQVGYGIFKPVVSNAMEAPSCDISSIQIVGGDGDPTAQGGSGRGGVGLRVNGQRDDHTAIQILGATIKGGEGSIRGYALEIAEARVDIYSGHIDGQVIVAKTAELHIHGGTFTDQIEVFGDESMIEFVGCIWKVDKYGGDGFDEYEILFSSVDKSEDKGVVIVRVDEGGVIMFEDDECDEDISE